MRIKLLEQKGKLEACRDEIGSLRSALDEAERRVEELEREVGEGKVREESGTVQLQRERQRRKALEGLLGWEEGRKKGGARERSSSGGGLRESKGKREGREAVSKSD